VRVRLLGLCAVAGLVMMVAARAHADWRTGVPMKEAPNDVLEAWGPGRFSVGYAQGAYLFVDGGVAQQIHTSAPSVGTYYQPSDDCFITVSKDDFGGVRTDRAADGGRCPFPFGAPIIAELSSVERVRYAPGGGAAAVVSSSTARKPYVSGDSIYDAGTLSPMRGDVRIPDLTGVLGVGQVGDAGYALFGTTSSEAAVVWIKLSDTLRAETQTQTGTTLGIVRTMDVFSAGRPANPFPYAVVGTQSGAMLQGSILESLEPIKPVQTLDGPVSGVSMNVGAGGDAGVGFGMAIVVLPDGGSQVVSPVPMLSDTKAGTVWRVRSVPESITKAPLRQVVCTEARSCVFTAPQPDKDNIFFYTNDAGPEISVTAPGASVVAAGTETTVTLDEDAGYRFTFAAEDPDGDPVLVTATPPSGPGWTVVPDAGQRAGDPVVWDVTTSATCANQSLGSFTVSASDGLAAHEAYETVRVSVKHTRPPEVPPVVFADGRTVPGGGDDIVLATDDPPLVLRMTGGDTTAAGCRIHPRWEPLFSGTGVPSLAQDGGTALITPPHSFCAPEDGRFGFRLRVTDDAGLSSAQDFTVRVPATELMAFDAGVLQFDAGEGPSPSGELRVRVESNLNCPDSRGLHAELWLERMDGGEVMPPETVPISGTWQGRLDEVCGRPMLLKGVLKDDAGQRSPVFAQQVATPRMDVGLEPLPGVPALVARCGEQARVELTQTFPPGTCQTPDVTWEQDGGPPLEQSVLSGTTVSLVTRDTGLDALVGKSLVMRVTASAGPDNESSHLVTVPITVEPFVRVRRRTELPAASETGLVGVSVELHNTSACGVMDVSYRESLEGLTFVEGSAKFDGHPVEADWKSQALTVTGLTLPGEGTGTLTYVARPHLVGERRMEGEARLGNEVISLRDDPGIQVPDSGCGCSGSGPGPVLFALGALVAAVRRRRR
jgi:MYXO-CTERM domain-containing protein